MASFVAVENIVFLYHIDLFLISILGLFIIVKLPRIIALFGTTSERFDGYFLHYIPYRPSTRAVYNKDHSYPPPGPIADDVHTSDSCVTATGAPVTTHYPPHVGSCIKFLRPCLKLLRFRISPGFSITQSVILVFYFACLVYASFYRSNIFTDGYRTGWVAIAQLPFVFAFSQKNNVLSALLGYGYDKLNFFHRFAGILVVLAANVHGLCHLYKAAIHGTTALILARPHIVWGIVALACFDMIFFFSTQYCRERAYNFFLTTHITGFILVLPALYLHQSPTHPFIFVCIGFFVFDYLMRILKSRITTAIVHPVPDLDSTRVEISKYNAGWRAGQHIRLRVLSSGMGWFGWAEIHPFTIASVSRGQDGIVLICKKTGTWTKNLYEIAKSGEHKEGETGRNITVVVEGPYGGPGHKIFSSFSAAVVIAGGSGISFALSVIQDLVQKDLKAESRVKVIELVWVVRDPESLAALLPNLTSLIERSTLTALRINVFYTRAAAGNFSLTPETFCQSGLTLTPGRPRFSSVLDSAISRIVGLGPKDGEKITGLVVAVCGPTGLVDDVADAVSGVEAVRRDSVGGIELHEEDFRL